MARYGTWRPLGPQTQPLMRAHDVFCIHTMVGSLAGTDSMFKQNGYGGTESHFGTGSDGTTWQWQDLLHTADANLNGNPYVISVENADFGVGFPDWDTNDGSAVPEFTDAQVSRLVDLGYRLCLPGTHPDSLHRDCPRTWDCYTKGIPAKLIPDTKPGRRGIAYHAQGVPGNELVPGGVAWSTARGKVCPGWRRIAQVKTVIIPAIAARLAGQEEDMPLNSDDKKWIQATVEAAVAKAVAGVPAAVWKVKLTSTHNSYTAQSGAWLVYGNQAAAASRDAAQGAEKVVNTLPATVAKAAADATTAAAKSALLDNVVNATITVNGVQQ